MIRSAPFEPPAIRLGGPARDLGPQDPRSRRDRLRSSLWPSGRLLLPFLLAAAGSGPLLAQAVPIRAGEHEDFTRLVLRVPEGDAWTLVPAPGGFELRAPAGTAFDTEEVFGRIPRDRIAALDARDGGRLGITIACDCHGEVFWQPGAGLVVDVVDGPAPSGAVVPWPAAPARPADPALPLVTEAPASPLIPGPWDAPLTIPPREAARVALTEAAILESVAAAARHGFLDLAPGIEAGAPTPKTEEPRRDQDAAASAGDQPGLALRTGAEVIGPQEPLGATGTACLSEDDLDLAGWAGSGDFGTEISARIAAVTDARDLLDPAAAEALARAYLAYGFGREARVALDLDRRSSRARDVLRHLAQLLDGEPVPSMAFEDQAGCLGPVALWRALARGTLQGTDDRERTAITLALRELPDGAREAVALRLAGLFLDAGDAAGAEVVAAHGGEAGGEALLPRAEIVQEIEGPEAALADLEQAAGRDPRMTPEALAELLDLLVDEGRPVDEDLLELARALRFEHGGSRVLLLAEARALSAEGRFEEALALLDGERAGAPGADLEEALAATVETLTIELGDGPFLEIALGGLPDRLPPVAADAVARRLSDLGFPNEAWALRSPGAFRVFDEAASPTGSDAPPPDLTASARTETQPVLRPAAEVLSRLPPAAANRVNSAEGPIPSTPDGTASLSGVATPPAPPLAEPLGPVRDTPPTPASATRASAGALPPGVSGDPPNSAETTPVWSSLDASSDPFPAPIAQPPEPAPATAMSLAERRSLLVQAEETRARAAALLEQGLAD